MIMIQIMIKIKNKKKMMKENPFLINTEHNTENHQFKD